MLTQIEFGVGLAHQFVTSGWRAVRAEEFTFANVRRTVVRHCALRGGARN